MKVIKFSTVRMFSFWDVILDSTFSEIGMRGFFPNGSLVLGVNLGSQAGCLTDCNLGMNTKFSN